MQTSSIKVEYFQYQFEITGRMHHSQWDITLIHTILVLTTCWGCDIQYLGNYCIPSGMQPFPSGVCTHLMHGWSEINPHQLGGFTCHKTFQMLIVSVSLNKLLLLQIISKFVRYTKNTFSGSLDTYSLDI